MNAKKAILLTSLTLSLAVTLTLTIHATNPEEIHDPKPLTTSTNYKRASRFLAEKKEKNPRGADHCHKDGDVCGTNTTRCCNNKCVDLRDDKHNCGACKLKCKFTETCCRGKCVNLSFDKRNCGSCGNKCKRKEYCVYGMCNYA